MSRPEALRLADALETFHNPNDKQAAAELRRLHAQRDSLLEALKALDVLFSPCVRDSTQADWIDKARAAIAKAEGQ